MPEGSENLTAYFTCSFQRPNLRVLPEREDALLSALRAVTPPEELRSVHDPDHLVSFTQHVRDIVARPVQIMEINGRRCVHVLGQAVFARAPDGTHEMHVWWRSSETDPWGLHQIPMDQTPFLDFPRTELWKENLAAALLEEARHRIADHAAACDWAAWAWSWVEFKAIALVDKRRLRSQIRHGLDLDRRVLRLLRRRRRFRPGVLWSMNDYNRERQGLDATLDVEREAPGLLPFLWALRDHPLFDSTLEPKKALRFLARKLGVTPQQWKLIASSASHRHAVLYRTLCREFFAGDECRNAVEYLKLVRLLRPTRPSSLDFWRQVLSLFGTRDRQPADGYEDELARYRDSLRHLVRLSERRAVAGLGAFPEEELHAVLQWIFECKILGFARSQRAGGWELLVRRAMRYRVRSRLRTAPDVAWDGLLQDFVVEDCEVVPLDSAGKLWEEAAQMRHCADAFLPLCARGECVLFSIRRRGGKRLATVAYQRLGDLWVTYGIAGKANSEPGPKSFGIAQRTQELLQQIPVAMPCDAGAEPQFRLSVEFPQGSWIYDLESDEDSTALRPRMRLPESFPEGTIFADCEGIPVTDSPNDLPLAWDLVLAGEAESPRFFGPQTLSSDGVFMKESAFRERFDPDQAP